MSDEQFLRFKGCIYRADENVSNPPPGILSDIWVRKDAIEAIFEYASNQMGYSSFIGHAVLHINSGKQILVEGNAMDILLDMEDA